MKKEFQRLIAPKVQQSDLILESAASNGLAPISLDLKNNIEFYAPFTPSTFDEAIEWQRVDQSLRAIKFPTNNFEAFYLWQEARDNLVADSLGRFQSQAMHLYSVMKGIQVHSRESTVAAFYISFDRLSHWCTNYPESLEWLKDMVAKVALADSQGLGPKKSDSGKLGPRKNKTAYEISCIQTFLSIRASEIMSPSKSKNARLEAACLVLNFAPDTIADRVEWSEKQGWFTKEPKLCDYIIFEIRLAELKSSLGT